MQCFVFSRDLMFSSQASGAASAAGWDVTTIGRADQVDASEPHVVVLDLGMPNLPISEIVATLQQHDCVKIIAVAPHVHEAKLHAAKEAGCDFVLTKGQASRELVTLLSAIASGEA